MFEGIDQEVMILIILFILATGAVSLAVGINLGQYKACDCPRCEAPKSLVPYCDGQLLCIQEVGR